MEIFLKIFTLYTVVNFVRSRDCRTDNNMYNVKLIARRKVAERTMEFTFEKPEGFVFKAGQWGDFTLINPKDTDAEGNTRGFSFVSPPSAKELMVATRLRDTAFKRELKELPLGSQLKLEGPGGSFTLHHNPSIPAVFLAGGIGITPVRSIIMQATADKLPHQIYLFYSNNRPEDAAFLDDLGALEKENVNYKFIPTMTGVESWKKTWNGELGFINQEMLKRYIPDLTKPIYYISGPKVMVSAMRQMLNTAGIDDDNIRTEEFSGY